jgi:hypothetical protein
VLWWVGGTLALMWALMFFLLKQTSSQADRAALTPAERVPRPKDK